MRKSALTFTPKLPPLRDLGAVDSDFVLIYDQILEKKSTAFLRWSRFFKNTYPVRSGEELKAVEKFPQHVRQIAHLTQNLSSRNLIFVVAGGGSVGDFGGFLASVFKRGVGLVHIPTTWLAAIDSSHGGKTALNVGGIKNQIGSFYAAQKIFLVKEILLAQPEIRCHEAFSEIYKVALLQGGSFWRQLSSSTLTSENLWRFLPAAIAAKNKIVARDPLEKSGHRHLLNFGHTMGHVFETLFSLPHGIAVNYGLRFALDWGAHRHWMSKKEKALLEQQRASSYLLSPSADGFLKSADLKKMKAILSADKKKVRAQKVRFIFCVKPGQFKIEDVGINEILHECRRQGRL